MDPHLSRGRGGFSHPGPWRFFPVAAPSLIGHHDIAPYNVCFEDDKLAGVFDWDLAGPSTPLLELAFIAWNCVPLWRDIGPGTPAGRLRVIAAIYGTLGPRQILHAVPPPDPDHAGRHPSRGGCR
jgi:Phosphotransferase enzyme family